MEFGLRRALRTEWRRDGLAVMSTWAAFAIVEEGALSQIGKWARLLSALGRGVVDLFRRVVWRWVGSGVSA